MALLDQVIAQNRHEAAAMRTVQARERVRASMVPLNPTQSAQPPTASVTSEHEVDAAPTIASPLDLEAASALFGGTGRPPSQGPPPARAKVDSVFAQLQRFSNSDAGAVDDDDDDSSTPDAWLDSDESESDSDELRVAHTPMPQVSERSMDEVLGGGTGGDGGQKSLLARVLDPAGGTNRTGLEGLLANERPSDPRERLRQRRRALERQRSGMTEDDYIYDKRGRRVRGARKMTMDDVKMGLVPPSQKASVDRTMTKEQIRRNVAQMRADSLGTNGAAE